jgi:hypothetical protein
VGHEVPTAFTNGNIHERQKEFCFQLLDRFSPTIGEVMDQVLSEHLRRWTQRKSFVWDDEIESLWSDFLFQWILDTRPRRGLVHQWVANILWPQAAESPCLGFVHSKRAYAELLALVRTSPRFEEIAELAHAVAGLDETRTAKQLLFYLGFNAWGGLQGLTKSAFGELSLHPELQTRIAADVSTTAVAPHDLPIVRNTVYEVLRTHPPVFFVYGVLQEDATVESYTGAYHVRRGERLVGNIWFAQRDARVFPDPDEFNPDRFQDASTLKYLVWANGYGDCDSAIGNKMCAGKTTVYVLMRRLLAGLSRGNEWELAVTPFWSTRKFIPAGAPTNRLSVRHFVSRSPLTRHRVE